MSFAKRLLVQTACVAGILLPLLLQKGFAQAVTQAAPKLVTHDGRHALLVDGTPYLVLGAQINNSSSWPAVLPQVWPALQAMHVNTAEAPVYWEQIEPTKGTFDWTNVDALIDGARANHLHLVLLWFGTWKNGNDHYVPRWVKEDTAQYPRMMNSDGTPLDDLSANAPVNMEADRTAFAALMRHVAERDGAEHTVLMMQVENEAGGIGSVRDFSPMANRQFAQAVPAELAKALGKKPGTWTEVFAGKADEAFQAWSQARYINAVAAAGKQAFDIPMYCNVWLAYPPAALPERRIAIAGIGYPSGGPVESMLPLWKAGAPAIDIIGPDMYSSNADFYLHILDTYARPDNALWVPETGSSDEYAPYFFAALGRGAVGFSPFGVDWTRWTYSPSSPGKDERFADGHAENYALMEPMDRTVALLNYEGKLQTAIEAAGGAEQEMLFGKSGNVADKSAMIEPMELANATMAVADAGTSATRTADDADDWVAEARFGYPQRDGEPAPGTAKKDGRVMVAQLAPAQFLITGVDVSVYFHRPGYLPGIRMQILKAEEGYYTPGTSEGAAEVWHSVRWLNGDQTDRGIQFHQVVAGEVPHAVKVTVGRF